jgi:uncharacterized membrane protein YgdD (TMEM256/DUF423 family)
MLAAFETGVRYHLIHALGILSAGLSLCEAGFRMVRSSQSQDVGDCAIGQPGR